MPLTPPAALSPPDDYERSSSLARPLLMGSVLGAHVLAGWALLQVDVVRDAVRSMAPLMVELVAAPAPTQPTPPPPPPAPPAPRPAKPPPPRLLAAAPSPTPALHSLAVPPLPPEPPAPAQPPAPAPPAPPAPASPPAPAPPAPAVPRSIPPTAVQYLDAPNPVYPGASRRLGEAGRVHVRVEIDTQGRARQVHVTRSSGHARLDEAALAAVRAARFKPYTENGEPLPVWTTVPIVFELE